LGYRYERGARSRRINTTTLLKTSMSSVDDFSQLKNSHLFRGVEFESVTALVADCPTRRLQQGEALLEPGVINHSLYIVLAGELRIYLRDRTLPYNAVLGVGECVGELSLIDGKGATALVLAAEATDLLVIPDTVLWSMIDQYAGIARNLLHIISGRMRNDSQILLLTQSRSREFEQAASLDPLTGLHNRRWMADAFPRALRRGLESGHPVCLVMADVDHFKGFNDRHGHLTGDRVLREVAVHLAESLRTDDLVARYGGEEFAILLPNTDLHTAIAIAERLRTQVAGMAVSAAAGIPDEAVTISCGVAAMEPGIDLDGLIALADGALYRAKAEGRNQVHVATPSRPHENAGETGTAG
jgi:diguanylate cyclase (GGDEF)-like protein